MQVRVTRRQAGLAFLALGALPLVGGAQPAKVPRIGVFVIGNLDFNLDYFREAMREAGYIDGRNVVLEVRSANGDAAAGAVLAAELVRLPVDLIVAFQTPAVQAAKQATTTIPIVMGSAGDAVATGLIASLARPGGNITGNSGATTETAAKLLEIIREIRPATRSVAVLSNRTDPFTGYFLQQIEAAAKVLGIAIKPGMVSRLEEYDAVFADWAAARVDTVIVQPSLNRKRAAELAIAHRLISASPFKVFASEGGLISYGPNARVLARKAVGYVDKILKGAKPADLPVELPTEFDLDVNLKTAKAIGFTIPKSLLARANEVIS
jgi:putative ABC transport system substrate-binding protein